jgi:hypothetical protein
MITKVISHLLIIKDLSFQITDLWIIEIIELLTIDHWITEYPLTIEYLTIEYPLTMEE